MDPAYYLTQIVNKFQIFVFKMFIYVGSKILSHTDFEIF